MFIPGMFIGTGVDEGDGLGVGEGIGIECPECCAIADSAMTREIATTRKHQTICEVLIRGTRSLLVDKWRGLKQHRARLRRTQINATLRYDFFTSFMFFMSHESPQQQHSCLSEEAA